MIQVNMHEAKTQLSRLVEAVESGERVVIARAGIPVVELVPHQVRVEPRRGGQWQGKLLIPDDFNKPCPEIEEMFGV